jgi:hypothetical protein
VALSSDVNSRVFFFALAVALLTGLLFGLVPALPAGRAQPTLAWKEESYTVAGGAGLRKALVVGQIALALVLLIGAGLFVRTLASLRAQGPGFVTTNLLLFRVDLARSGHAQTQSKSLMRNLLAAIRALPEVESAGLSAAELLSGGSWNQPLTIESGRRLVTDTVHCNAISPGFLETLGVPILHGRVFNERDAHDIQNLDFRSAIINESLAKRYLQRRKPPRGPGGPGEHARHPSQHRDCRGSEDLQLSRASRHRGPSLLSFVRAWG